MSLRLLELRRDVIAQMNSLREDSRVSRSRMYVWLHEVLKLPAEATITVKEFDLERCNIVLEAVKKERANKYVTLLSGVKPLHQRNSLAGTVHEARLMVPNNGKAFLSVEMSGHTWDAPVVFCEGVERKGAGSMQTNVWVEFRGENPARIYASIQTSEHFAEIPVGQFWTHG